MSPRSPVDGDDAHGGGPDPRSWDDPALVVAARGPSSDVRDAARREVTDRYRPLVVARAARLHRDRGTTHDDVISSGQVGLLKAIRDFDVDRGVPFAAYAEAKVVGEMMRWFRDSRYVAHVPRPVHERSMAVAAAERVLESELSDVPSLEQVAARCGLTPGEVEAARTAGGARRERRGELPPELLQPPDVTAVDHEAVVALRSALDLLGDDDRRLLVERYWDEVPQRVIGERLGISQAHVSRLERRAIDRLRTIVGDRAA